MASLTLRSQRQLTNVQFRHLAYPGQLTKWHEPLQTHHRVNHVP